MKKFWLIILCLGFYLCSYAQDVYWVFLTDKANTQFDPFSYFDAKAIERRKSNGLSLLDSTDFPLNVQYVTTIAALSDEIVGESRWLNAVAVVAADIDKIRQLPFVKQVSRIMTEALPAQRIISDTALPSDLAADLSPQLARMGGQAFVQQNINGKGKRIAILDGGFPQVDTHSAFQHLRTNHQIIKTYNFPNKKENVYGWSSHGTMVLSCIAGIYGDKLLGLATGAEFLLARTEVNLEPAKEEVWWVQGMEWADKNGADIINSSLGYGKDRYKVEDMDGQTSVVSRAANMAADKGILVCNSMGNEGDDGSWRTLVTPADADKILSVGGIEDNNMPSSFTSLGPTADGRLKPNVCAFGTATVANPYGTNACISASGTSFSSPLVAGFSACAWQLRPGLTALQMKAEIEKSGDRYPYYDYTRGYGVPQADYFIAERTIANAARFISFIENDSTVTIQVTDSTIDQLSHNELSAQNTHLLAFHVENESQVLIFYCEVSITAQNKKIVLAKQGLLGKTLRVWYNGAVASFRLSAADSVLFAENPPESVDVIEYCSNIVAHRNVIPAPELSKFSVSGKHNITPFFTWGFAVPSHGLSDYKVNYGKSENFSFGVRYKGNICKWYSLGAGLEIGAAWFSLEDFPFGEVVETHSYERQTLRVSSLQLELYQRFRLCPGTLFGYGVYLDMGVFGGWNFHNRIKNVERVEHTKTITIVSQNDFINKWDYGVCFRLGYGLLAVYAQYRFSTLQQKKLSLPYVNADLPKIQIGLQLTIPTSL